MNALTQTQVYRSSKHNGGHDVSPPVIEHKLHELDARSILNRSSFTPTARRVSPGDGLAAEQRLGRVCLVGAGPGDPELLTLRAARRIAEADAVVYDNLVGEGILDLARKDALRIYVGKKAGNHALPQDDINRLLVELASRGLNVVRLKGGDPLIFGRGGEEMEDVLAAGFPCEIVPGVTAASGMAASTGIPLTHRDYAQTVTFTTGHLRDGSVNLDWVALARPHQTVVIYMGMGALEIICRELIAHGLPPETPAAVVHAATTPEQRIVTSPLRTLPDLTRQAGLRTPSLIVIGSVVELYDIAQTAAAARNACSA